MCLLGVLVECWQFWWSAGSSGGVLAFLVFAGLAAKPGLASA
jgi:hypothetical protein